MADRAALELAAYAALELAQRAKRWRPYPGPQGLAMQSEADILFYGGAAGGGKTDLLLGTARYLHNRCIIFRRVSPSLQGIIDRSKEIYTQAGDGTLDNYNAGHSRWTLDGRLIRFGSIQYDADVTDYQGQPYDLYGFDEITEFTENQFRFVTGWNRTTRPGQRCRTICTGNPPTDSDGEWVLTFWGPWLDPNHPHPALPGELRYYTTIAGKDVECPNGDPVEVDGEMVKPLSRTFIPAKVQDNPALMASGYIAHLQALPEPLRSKMLYGDFQAGREDNAYQVIPSAWVEESMARWEKTKQPKAPMTAIGVDVARGGRDKTCLAPRWLHWFGKVHAVPGASTPDGAAVAGLTLVHAKDRAQAVVDVIGVGASAYDFLKTNEAVRALPYNGAGKSWRTDKSGQLHFINKRAESYWLLREALDPASQLDLCLPPDSELKADLCAPRWKPTPTGILIEPKEDLAKRIGRSPDKGDAVVMCWAAPGVPTEEEPQEDRFPGMDQFTNGGSGWLR